MSETRARGIWWLHPGWIVLAMAAVIITAAYFIPDSSFRSDWRTPKYFDSNSLLICCAAVATFALGAFTGTMHGGRPQTCVAFNELSWEWLRKTFSFCFWCTATGYATWAGAAAARGVSLSLVTGVLRGEKGAAYTMKETYLGTISGVTTLTQFGIAAVVLGAVMGARSGWKTVRLRMAAIFAMALVRAVLNSERLAVIELAIPLALVLLRLKLLNSERLSSRARSLLPFAPVVACVGLLLVFAGFEYLRSWTSFYAGGDLGFWQFASLRLVGYYVTALNNGAVILHYVGTTSAPYFILRFLWKLPVISQALGGMFPNLPWDNDGDPYMTVLDLHANPEFNNGSGYFMPAVDVGLTGSLIYWLLAGIACGVFYRLYTRQHIAGLLFYPVLFVGVAEMPRILYWGEGRIFPVYVILAIIAWKSVSAARKLPVAERPAMEAVEAGS
ncbi:MAG TPA: hypothetical protein VFA04_26305 [Bryobacteraceae bacterium]|nr:hypothetical protein [Bryobacteraceae bacterium]